MPAASSVGPDDLRASGGETDAVVVRGLVKRYGPTDAVRGLDLGVPAGRITAVLGPNGAGKTTTIECCEGYRRPDSGHVRVLGLDPARDAARLRVRVGVMLQDGGGLYPGARAAELVDHFARLYAHPLDRDAIIDRLGLRSVARTAVRRLSGGQRQRLALALAIIGRPEIAFLDEPSSGLDPHARLATWELLADLRRDGVTVVLTTHLMEEAERLADHVVIVDHGRTVASGSPLELTASSGTDLEVTFAGPVGLDLASMRAVLPAGAAADEVGRGRYRVRGPVDPYLLAQVTAWCATHDVMPHGLSVSRRTLEDVFLDLTGHALR